MMFKGNRVIKTIKFLLICMLIAFILSIIYSVIYSIMYGGFPSEFFRTDKSDIYHFIIVIILATLLFNVSLFSEKSKCVVWIKSKYTYKKREKLKYVIEIQDEAGHAMLTTVDKEQYNNMVINTKYVIIYTDYIFMDSYDIKFEKRVEE